jgi:hypothetical protein
MKKTQKKHILELIKASRKKSRDEEIELHGKAIKQSKVLESKKVYRRNKNKDYDLE